MPALQHLISPDQTGFMPKTGTEINLRRVFTHTQLGTDISNGGILFFLDLEKAFNSIDWQYMKIVMETFGFGSQFRRWISILYQNPSAAIKLNDLLSDFFPVGRGARQGCPMSPGLFASFIEPWTAAMRVSSKVQGIQVRRKNSALCLRHGVVFMCLWLIFTGSSSYFKHLCFILGPEG